MDNNITLIIIYAALAVLTLLQLLLMATKKRKRPIDFRYMFFVSMLLGWQLVLICYYAVTDPEASLFLYDMNLPFVALTALSLLLYILQFYGLDSYVPTTAVVALFIIPAFTFVLCLTGPLHHFVRSELTMISTYPAHIVEAVRGPWFWFHAAYCYALFLVCILLVIRQHSKLNRIYRKPSILLILGLSLSLSGNAIVLSTRSELDSSLVTASVASLILYFATKNNQSLEFFRQARREVFHYINKGILIMDNDGNVINLNRNARSLLHSLSISVSGRAYPYIEERFRSHVKKARPAEAGQGGTDYYLKNGDIYNIRKKQILDNHENQLGMFLVSTNVKQNRQVIDYLDHVAGIDILTGLSNRRQMQEDMESLEKAGKLPLAVIMGDLNGLKEVNDDLGHQQGDIYLRAAAETLKTVCPPHAHIARIGGDEFSILVPDCTEQQAQQLIHAIKAAFAALHGYPFHPSIALGYAIKKEPQQDMESLCGIADEAMYHDKRQSKVP